MMANSKMTSKSPSKIMSVHHDTLNHLLALSVGMAYWPNGIDKHAQGPLSQMTVDLTKLTCEIP